MQPGRFITIEGGEGVGKSTQIVAARACVEAAGFSVVLTREPGGTDRAERIRELLLTPSAEVMPEACELLLLFAARSTHIENVIRPALQRGTWVICDRFTDASYAYQGAGRAIPQERIAYLEAWVQNGLKPDLTLLLDAPVELALARAQRRNLANSVQRDRFEHEQRAFFERVRQAYLAIAAADPARVAVIDASQSIELVRARVEAVLSSFIERCAV